MVIKYPKMGFNTASGRYYCNAGVILNAARKLRVSIPQAVGTIAMGLLRVMSTLMEVRFNTASGRYYCNLR